MAGGPVLTGIDSLKGYEQDELTRELARDLAATMIDMNKAVFEDIAWQHEAFLTGGVKGLELLSEYSLQQDIVPTNLAAWQAIDAGNPEAVAEGNLGLLFREQWIVLQPHWNRVSFLGIPIGWMARSPLPKGLSFTDFSDSALESIGDFNARWPWLRDDMWPKWLALTDAQRRALADAPPGSRMGDP